MSKTKTSGGNNTNMLLGDMEANRPNNQLKEEKVLISKEGRMGKRRDKGPLFFIINIVVSLN